MSEKNLEIVFNEVSDLLRNQQDSIDLLFNKLNWILVSNIVLLVGLFSSENPNIFVISLLVLSISVALIGFNPKAFNLTVKIEEQLKYVKNDNFIISLINRKKQIFESNNRKVTEVYRVLKFSSGCLIASLLVQCFVLYV